MGYGTDSDESYLESGRNTARALRELLAEHGEKFEGPKSLLEWGCSTGRVLRHFEGEAEQGEVWGVDRDEDAIRWAKANLSPPFRFVTCTSYPHLPFEDAKFSFIYGISVLTHLEHLVDTWLLELRRIMKGGGLAVFTVHDDHTARWMLQYGRMPWIPEDLNLNQVPEHDIINIRIESGNWRGKYTFFSDAWIEREWGQYFDVLEIKPYAEGYQSAVVLRKS